MMNLKTTKHSIIKMNDISLKNSNSYGAQNLIESLKIFEENVI